MLKCYVFLCCSNLLNFFDSLLYDWYDEGIFRSGLYVCVIGLWEVFFRVENVIFIVL